MDYPIKTLSQLRPILVGFRKEAGLTQEAIARRLGISQQSYAAFEANPATASVERLFRVLRQFDVAIKLGTPEPSEPSAPSIGPATPPARMQARAGRKEADAASQPDAASRPAPARTASSVSRKRRSPPAAGSGAPRSQRATSKTREDW